MKVYWKAGDETSANPFELKGTVMQTLDPRMIALLLQRGEILGDNLSRLETAINSLYAGATPTNTLSLAEKVSALVAGSQDDLELYNNLVIMGRAHPSISMVLGQGIAVRIPSSGYSTFEIRDATSGEVMGRTILQAGAPVVLPAPGPIVRVPETSPMGNLNIRLRWDIPAPLRRLSLLQFGFNLYRVEKSAAQVWWGASAIPPSTENLLLHVEEYDAAKKVNRMPIVVDPATATSNTWYAVDDNDGQLPGGTPFVDGKKYYYYVTALDLLGRDGDLSAPFLTFPCDRMAPTVPHGVKTRTISVYTNSVREQYVEISWDHNTNDTDTARYYVYRFGSIGEMQSNAVYAVSNRISSAIIPSVGQTRMSYEDHSLSSNDWSRTYWYTVRAEDDASCGNNLSGNSAPLFGLVRDWEGPPIATNVETRITEVQLFCDYLRTDKPELIAPYNMKLSCSRDSSTSQVAWAEFSYYSGEYRGVGSEDQAIPLGRFYFRDGSVRVAQPFYLKGGGRTFTCFCRVGSFAGEISEYAYHVDPELHEIFFTSQGDFITTLIGPGLNVHRWGPGPKINYPEIQLPPVEGAETYRIYRRGDGGARTLLAQGELDEVYGALITDISGGCVNGGRICYYYQLIDENGNPGPLVKICCFLVEPRVDLPTPVLEEIDPTGSVATSTGMELNWFCTTPGVERFELAVSLDDDPLPSTFSTSNYPLQNGASNLIQVVADGVTNDLYFGFYQTGRVGTTFGTAGSPLFTLEASISMDRTYSIMVRAIGVAAMSGPWSNVRTFRWNTVSTPGPQVPWPARPMPPVQTSLFSTNLQAVFLDSSIYSGLYNKDYVGIRVGEIPDDKVGDIQKPQEYPLTDIYEPMDFLYPNAFDLDHTAFPCGLYRYQLTNDLFQSVSGDVVQVSPLMEQIAWAKTDITTIMDPFMVLTRPIDRSDPAGLYLIDTQPVVHGATYQYLLLRFNEETWEMDRIIPAGTVEIP
jgi:hypothetical protein